MAHLYNYIQHTGKRWTVLCLMLLTLLPASAQEIIRVTGHVVSEQTGQPLYDIEVKDYDSKETIARTDVDGRFVINIRSNGTLMFSSLITKAKVVKVKGQAELEVKLNEDFAEELKEAKVTGHRIKNDVILESADPRIVGNKYIFKTSGGIPKPMFHSNNRLVLQPVVHNATRNEDILGKAVVIDAGNYNRTQQRLYAFEMDQPDGDPLAKFIKVEHDSLINKNFKDDRITILRFDTVEVKDPTDEFYVNVYQVQENYLHIIKRDTTTTGFGAKNPLRWFDFKLAASELTDTAYYPKAKEQPREENGEIDLRFERGKDVFDINDPHNSEEIKKVAAQAEAIQSQKGSKLDVLNIYSSSSPDGGYQLNFNLAHKRLEYVYNYLISQIPMRKGMQIGKKPSVATWHNVAELMRKDSLFDEADMVERVDAKFKDPTKSRAMRNLEFYDSLLEKRYLPMLRKVTYKMNDTIKRQLRIDEIKAYYDENYKQLTQYEFFALYRAEKDLEKREKILRQALEVSPSFMLAANDLSVLLTQKGEPDPTVLERFVGNGEKNWTSDRQQIPALVKCNQLASLLMAKQFSKADTLAFYIPETEDTRYIRGINDIFNGRVKKRFAEMAGTSQRNAVVLLLAMEEADKNEQALDASLELPEEEALTFYLRAICYSRTKRTFDEPTLTLAERALRKAIKMDPELEKIAINDGDVVDLIIDKKTGQRKW